MASKRAVVAAEVIVDRLLRRGEHLLQDTFAWALQYILLPPVQK
jgi:hypothetical protein